MIQILSQIFAFFHRIIFGVASKSIKKSSKQVIVEQDDFGVAKIILNRPNKKNAITEMMYHEIASSLRRLSKDDKVKVCLIVGRGDYYCAGNDLSNFSKVMHPLKMAHDAKELLELFVDSFIDFPKPLIAAVNGPAIGIAVTTLGLCDRVFVSDSAYFKTPFAQLGQSPEGCSSFMFPKIMGDQAAEEILWKGKVLDCREAVACGLAHSVEPKEEVELIATAYCRELAALPSSSPRLVRSIVQQNLVERLREVNRSECRILERKWVSKECFLALAAFLESRNMRAAALFLRAINYTGFLWGQPQ